MESPQTYSIEDYIVHNVFGIGRIRGIEMKSISGANVQYFKIQTKDSTFWIPIDRVNSDEMRPLSTMVEVRLAIAALLRSPKTMPSDHNLRKRTIHNVQLENKLEDVAGLIRDLRARQLERGELSLEDLNAMRALKQQLAEEWSIVTGEKTKEVSSRIDGLITVSLKQSSILTDS